jgi:hypothetical protein
MMLLLRQAVALIDVQANAAGDLSVRHGELLELLPSDDVGSDSVLARNTSGTVGRVPAAALRLGVAASPVGMCDVGGAVFF